MVQSQSLSPLSFEYAPLVVDSLNNKTVYHKEELFLSHKAKISGTEKIVVIQKRLNCMTPLEYRQYLRSVA